MLSILILAETIIVITILSSLTEIYIIMKMKSNSS